MKNRFRPGLELLEDRLVPANFDWLGTAGQVWGDSYADVRNWRVGGQQPENLPGVNDTVRLNVGQVVRDPVVYNNDLVAGLIEGTCKNIVIDPNWTGSHGLTIQSGAQLVLAGGESVTTTWGYGWGLHGEGEIVIKDHTFKWIGATIGVRIFTSSNSSVLVYGPSVSRWYSDYIHIGMDEAGNETTGSVLRFGDGTAAGNLNNDIEMDTTNIYIYAGNSMRFEQTANSENKGGFYNGKDLWVAGVLSRTTIDVLEPINVGANITIEGNSAVFLLGYECELEIKDPMDLEPSLTVKGGGKVTIRAKSTYLHAENGVVVEDGGNLVVEPHLTGLSLATIKGDLFLKSGGKIKIGDVTAGVNGMANLLIGSDADTYNIYLEGGHITFTGNDSAQLTASSTLRAGNDVIRMNGAVTQVTLEPFHVPGTIPVVNNWLDWSVIFADDFIGTGEIRAVNSSGGTTNWRGTYVTVLEGEDEYWSIGHYFEGA